MNVAADVGAAVVVVADEPIGTQVAVNLEPAGGHHVACPHAAGHQQVGLGMVAVAIHSADDQITEHGQEIGALLSQVQVAGHVQVVIDKPDIAGVVLDLVERRGHTPDLVVVVEPADCRDDLGLGDLILLVAMHVGDHGQDSPRVIGVESVEVHLLRRRAAELTSSKPRQHDKRTR
ncbi:hypothetical protein ACH5AI_31080 [Streptomyces collinus]|uniref:hypothetical protein n=1 Tax=Streptomyces collinus TaxID=42684 RepID=UPI00378E4339